MTVQEYQSSKKVYNDQAKKAASEFLENVDFGNKIDKLRIKKDEIILVLGESTADALNSGVYILQHILQLNHKCPITANYCLVLKDIVLSKSLNLLDGCFDACVLKKLYSITGFTAAKLKTVATCLIMEQVL